MRKKLWVFIKGFLLVNLFWFLLAVLLSTSVLPGPLTVYGKFSQVINGGLWLHIGASLGRVAAGLSLALLIGVPVGIFMASSAIANRILHPLVYFSYPVPKTALLPVCMLLLGLGNGSKILIIVLTTVFQIIVAVRDAAEHIDQGIYYVAKSAGARKRSILMDITLPAVLPELFTSIRIGTGTSLAILLIVEAYGTRWGMGYYILDAWSRINYIQMYGGIVIMSVVGAALFWILDGIQWALCKGMK
ncbi:MAG TPA: ABC transporter permease [Lachnoclostridium sp.]|uniref:NitT/TauT family transport system permease protein n=1 Tax=[Clostridium] celerecrescens 18A TaxID=1286362 RepID=A0A2M8ZAA3_9FIRM|nr:ABC transporter permease [Lacrimispora celerecrescens]PJJ30370.1 NitT/TauT family transport system permease protein [[Clostridium] celerecrescens 18A]HBE87050.1 ABC transporter permease [Lachnoclostridium sp.]